jgi:hypothetical protein
MNRPHQIPRTAAPANLPDPQTVLDDASLSRSDKVDKLLRWAHDALELEVANDEGMRGAVRPSNLAQVREALRELLPTSLRERGGPGARAAPGARASG